MKKLRNKEKEKCVADSYYFSLVKAMSYSRESILFPYNFRGFETLQKLSEVYFATCKICQGLD